MTHKIFYSWQSDRPNRTTRAFIEDALKKAIRNLGSKASDVYESPRDLEFDKDTKDTPGSPPVVDTIFRKIEQCAVFVPDLTFCGVTESGRPIPNPNVLIEYGWALAKLGHERILGVMNSAYGKPTWENVPFNIRHTRWPYDFCLEPHDDEETRRAVKRELVGHFEVAIRAALAVSPSDLPSGFPMQPKSSQSSFLDGGDILGKLPPEYGSQRSTEVRWRDGPRLFLRIVPDRPVGPYTALEIKEMINDEPLTPFCGPKDKRRCWMGNQWGGVVFEPGGTDRSSPDYIVQISRHGEIWGIDNYYLQSKRIADDAKEFERLGYRDREPRENVVLFFEEDYAQFLAEYLRFASQKLKVISPVNVIAGMTKIQGFQTYLPGPRQSVHQPPSCRHRVGCAAGPDIILTIEQVSLHPDGQSRLECHEGYPVRDDAQFRHAYKTLVPFFVHAWSEFGHARPDFLPT